MMKKRRFTLSSALAAIPVNLILLVVALLIVTPVIWLIFSTFKPEKEIISYPPTFFPNAFTLANFATVSQRIKIWRYVLNSVIYAGGTTALAVVVNSLAGYVYARYTFKGKNFFFLFTLATMMIPFQVIMVPSFLVVYKMGMYNTYWGLIIPRVAVATSIFMMRAAFTGLPKELEDAGRIDGLSEFGIYLRIMLPQVKPALICLIILSINGSWNDLLWPMLVAQKQNMFTAQIGMNMLVTADERQYGRILAGAMVSLMIPMVAFIIGQDYMIKGMADGALKE